MLVFYANLPINAKFWSLVTRCQLSHFTHKHSTNAIGLFYNDIVVFTVSWFAHLGPRKCIISSPSSRRLVVTSGQFNACLAVELSHVFPEHGAGDAVDERIDTAV